MGLEHTLDGVAARTTPLGKSFPKSENQCVPEAVAVNSRGTIICLLFSVHRNSPQPRLRDSWQFPFIPQATSIYACSSASQMGFNQYRNITQVAEGQPFRSQSSHWRVLVAPTTECTCRLSVSPHSMCSLCALYGVCTYFFLLKWSYSNMTFCYFFITFFW